MPTHIAMKAAETETPTNNSTDMEVAVEQHTKFIAGRPN